MNKESPKNIPKRGVSIETLLIPTLAVFVIALVTVIFKVWRVVLINPAEILRREFYRLIMNSTDLSCEWAMVNGQ